MHFLGAVFLPRPLAHQLHIWLLRGQPAESLLYNWTEIKSRNEQLQVLPLFWYKMHQRGRGEVSTCKTMLVRLLCKHTGEHWL